MAELCGCVWEVQHLYVCVWCVCECMYVCMCVCVCVCVCVFVCVSGCVGMEIVAICGYIHTHSHVGVCV